MVMDGVDSVVGVVEVGGGGEIIVVNLLSDCL
jgi:hypothetical protein